MRFRDKEREGMKSGKAVTDRKAEEALKQLDDAYRRRAKQMYHEEGECEIDDGAKVSISDDGDGAYVQAWVYVRRSEAFGEEDLPRRVLARWRKEDWNDETMTASRYTYYAVDGDTGYAGKQIELSDEDSARYSWGSAYDDELGGSQMGTLR